jgi:hypothetical protein
LGVNQELSPTVRGSANSIRTHLVPQRSRVMPDSNTDASFVVLLGLTRGFTIMKGARITTEAIIQTPRKNVRARR